MQNDKQSNSPTGHGDVRGEGLAVPKSASRRRLLQAGLGASPMVLTVISQPVRATSSVCLTASAFASVTANPTTSANVVTLPACGTSSGHPTYWVKQCGTKPKTYTGWPSNCMTAGKPKKFSDCIGTTKGVVQSTWTLEDCLNYGGTDSVGVLAKNLCAGYLNVCAGYTPTNLLSTSQITAIWNGAPLGSYNPTGTVMWDCNAANTWIVKTFVNA